jgi:predicted phosphodiesterase
MKLGILSDLHLSRAPQRLPASNADVYVLAGDIARPEPALAWARGLGKPVLYVPGNHEFYGGSLPEVLHELRRLAAGTRVHILDNTTVCLGGVRFVGSTLWSDFLLDGDGLGRERAVREALEKMHDFRRIHVDARHEALFTPLDSALLCRRNAAWLEAELRQPWSGATVVITHHAPSARSIAPRFGGSPLNACFASHLDHLAGGQAVSVWIHGHMHHSVDYDLRGTRVICNPRGYVVGETNENASFDIDLCIEVF